MASAALGARGVSGSAACSRVSIGTQGFGVSCSMALPQDVPAARRGKAGTSFRAILDHKEGRFVGATSPARVAAAVANPAQHGRR